MRILGLPLIDSSNLHDVFLSFGIFSALLHLKRRLHTPFIHFIIDFFFFLRESFEVFTFEIFFHKGGQTRYESSILPSQHCCHDDHARHSRPLRDSEKKERKWKDAERRYKMMRKLKQSNETGREETTTKSETNYGRMKRQSDERAADQGGLMLTTKQLIIHVIHPLTMEAENLQDHSPACVWALQGHSSDSGAKLWPARCAAYSNGGFSSSSSFLAMDLGWNLHRWWRLSCLRVK